MAGKPCQLCLCDGSVSDKPNLLGCTQYTLTGHFIRYLYNLIQSNTTALFGPLIYLNRVTSTLETPLNIVATECPVSECNSRIPVLWRNYNWQTGKGAVNAHSSCESSFSEAGIAWTYYDTSGYVYKYFSVIHSYTIMDYKDTMVTYLFLFDCLYGYLYMCIWIWGLHSSCLKWSIYWPSFSMQWIKSDLSSTFVSRLWKHPIPLSPGTLFRKHVGHQLPESLWEDSFMPRGMPAAGQWRG